MNSDSIASLSNSILGLFNLRSHQGEIYWDFQPSDDIFCRSGGAKICLDHRFRYTWGWN